MPASRMTFAQRGMSVLMEAAYASGVTMLVSKPSVCRRSCTSAGVTALAISALSSAIRSFGVFAGASTHGGVTVYFREAHFLHGRDIGQPLQSPAAAGGERTQLAVLVLRNDCRGGAEAERRVSGDRRRDGWPAAAVRHMHHVAPEPTGEQLTGQTPTGSA